MAEELLCVSHTLHTGVAKLLYLNEFTESLGGALLLISNFLSVFSFLWALPFLDISWHYIFVNVLGNLKLISIYQHMHISRAAQCCGG